MPDKHAGQDNIQRSTKSKEAGNRDRLRKKSYTIRPIPLSKGFRDKSQWTYRMGYGQKVMTCNYVWYIEGVEGGHVIVDAGAKAEDFNRRGLPDEEVQPLEEGLNTLGVDIRDISLVILTHLHWDHVALAKRFKNATFIVQKSEVDFALNPHPAVAAAYNKDLFAELNLKVIEGEQEILDGIRVILTPGHTPGGQSVAVRTASGLAVITGFCCSKENFYPSPEAKSKGLEVIPPGIHTDVLKAYDSALAIKRMTKTILPLHDPMFLEMSRIK